MNNLIDFKNVSKFYHTKEGEIKALNNINLTINEGEFIALVGPSGCGKSTILSILTSLDNNYKGTLTKKENLKISYMLQNDALLPWLTVYENAILGLKIQNKLDKEYLDYVEYLFKLYNLEDFKNNYPKSLSGGMKQRVSLIRTLALKPDLLLLDEAFNALDEQSRLLISDDVYKLARKEGKTIVLVTHNIEEAIYFSDKVVVLSKRPATIKNIISIDMDKYASIYERRKDDKFFSYFDAIWKDLEKNE